MKKITLLFLALLIITVLITSCSPKIIEGADNIPDDLPGPESLDKKAIAGQATAAQAGQGSTYDRDYWLYLYYLCLLYLLYCLLYYLF